MTLPYTKDACGGGFLGITSTYVEVGCENINFYGWGQEDGERLCRWLILEKNVLRVNGPMFHLWHPRGLNSRYLSELHRKAQIGEYYRIKNMNKNELIREIELWEEKNL